MEVLRHGDIVLREVRGLPRGRKQVLGTRFEQSGETGKLHVAENVEVVQVDWDKYLLTLQDGAVMTHPEHPLLELPPNKVFKVGRVRSIVPYVD